MLRKVATIVAVLTLVLATIVPALAQDGEFDTIPTEEPVATCAWGPTEVSSPENPYAPNALDPSDHAPGEFIVSYESVEAMWASPQENVKHQFNNWGWYYADTGIVYYPIPYEAQTLYFEDIASIADPCERFALEEAKRQEILTWPGVEYAEYNGIMVVDDLMIPASG
jgi:hypothetical protein